MANSADPDQTDLFYDHFHLGLQFTQGYLSRNAIKRTLGYERPAKIQIRLRFRAVWSALGACWIAKDTKFLHADNEDSDQTEWMRRLIWVSVGYVFSRCGSFVCKRKYNI